MCPVVKRRPVAFGDVDIRFVQERRHAEADAEAATSEFPPCQPM
jgi:hypothetical protein